MSSFRNYCRKFFKDESGIEFLEVAIIIVVTVILIVLIYALYNNLIKPALQKAGDDLNNATEQNNPNWADPNNGGNAGAGGN